MTEKEVDVEAEARAWLLALMDNDITEEELAAEHERLRYVADEIAVTKCVRCSGYHLMHIE